MKPVWEILEETKFTLRHINIIYMDTGVRQRTEPWTGDKIASHLMAYFLSSLCSFFFSYFLRDLGKNAYILCPFTYPLGSPGGASSKEPTCQNRRHKSRGFDSWVGKIPWRKAWQPTWVFLPGESPWTEEPGGLQSVGSQRVWHNRSNLAQHRICLLNRNDGALHYYECYVCF